MIAKNESGTKGVMFGKDTQSWLFSMAKMAGLVSAPPTKYNPIDSIVKVLFVREGDVNYLTQPKIGDGQAVMHVAAEVNECSMIEYLVSRGGNVCIKTTRLKQTPLMIAARKYVLLILIVCRG